MSLINDMQVIHLVLARAQLLQHLHIFARAPHCVDGNVELVGAAEEEGQFGERQLLAGETLLDRWLGGGLGNCFLDLIGEERRVLGNMAESPGQRSALKIN